MNDRSALQELRLSLLKKRLDEALRDGPASKVYAVLDDLAVEAGEREDIKEIVDTRRMVLEGRLEAVRAQLNRVMQDLREASGPESRVAAQQAAKDYIDKNAPYWEGTEGYKIFEDAQAVTDGIAKEWATKEVEKLANEFLDKAYKLMDAKAYVLAISYVDKVLTEYPVSAAAKKIRESNLKKVLQNAIDRKKREDAYVNRVLSRIRNYEMNKRYDDAIRIIITDPDYPVFPDNAVIKKKLDKLRELAAAGGG